MFWDLDPLHSQYHRLIFHYFVPQRFLLPLPGDGSLVEGADIAPDPGRILGRDIRRTGAMTSASAELPMAVGAHEGHPAPAPWWELSPFPRARPWLYRTESSELI